MKAAEIWLVNVTALFRSKQLELRAPLALLYLSAALKSRGDQVRILDIVMQYYTCLCRGLANPM